jgi:hypothetical protein
MLFCCAAQFFMWTSPIVNLIYPFTITLNWLGILKENTLVTSLTIHIPNCNTSTEYHKISREFIYWPGNQSIVDMTPLYTPRFQKQFYRQSATIFSGHWSPFIVSPCWFEDIGLEGFPWRYIVEVCTYVNFLQVFSGSSRCQ